MDRTQLQEYLYKRAKSLVEEFDLESFTIHDKVASLSWKGIDNSGFLTQLDRKIDLSLIERAYCKKVAIDEEIFICRELMNRALNDNFE